MYNIYLFNLFLRFTFCDKAPTMKPIILFSPVACHELVNEYNVGLLKIRNVSYGFIPLDCSVRNSLTFVYIQPNKFN